MDNHQNLAAWMIGGGRHTVDPVEARNAIHLRALAASLAEEPRRPGLVGRLAAATRAALRPEPAAIEPACCPA
jgi:hypothetical protein